MRTATLSSSHSLPPIRPYSPIHDSDDSDDSDDNGAAEHTGFEDVDYPDELGGEDDTADRIADDEVEEIEFDGVRVATDEESRASAGAGEVAEDLDIPSSEDEMPDEELLPYPDALKKTFEPVPESDELYSMVEQVKPGSMVAIFYYYYRRLRGSGRLARSSRLPTMGRAKSSLSVLHGRTRLRMTSTERTSCGSW
jgi:hypothetical protein